MSDRLFRATFLVLGSANAGGRKYNDVQRFEKLANIIKQFKLGCTKCVKGTFSGMEVRNSNFTAIISPLTPNTFVLVVTDASIRTLQIVPSMTSNVFLQPRRAPCST